MTLPVYGVEIVHVDSEDGSTSRYIVTCPRCEGEFWVALSWATLVPVEGAGGQVTLIIGRPCPYCSKAAEIPAEIRIEPRRRIVKRKKSRR